MWSYIQALQVLTYEYSRQPLNADAQAHAQAKKWHWDMFFP
jgi:hypothetical protein